VMNDIFLPLEKFVGHPLEQDLKDNIRPKEKDGMYLYTYSDKVIVPRDHPVLIKCRGLVLDKNGKVLNYPFDRFFNPHEKESTDIDWDTAQIQEKFDDSLICVFRYNDEWQITTRGSFYPNPIADVDFAELFRKHFTHFDVLQENFCFMFGLVTDKNRIVTWYDEPFVALLGARNLITLLEVPYPVVRMTADMLQVRSPRIYEAKNLEDCRRLFATLKDDEEGFVAVDMSSNRLKLKQDSYLALAKIKMLKNDDILDYVRGNIELDGELLQKDQTVSQRVEEIRVEWYEFLETVDMIFDGIKDLPSRKEFALEAISYPFRGFLFARLDGHDLRKSRLDYESLLDWIGDQRLATTVREQM